MTKRHELITAEELADLKEIDRLLHEANNHAAEHGELYKHDDGGLDVDFGNHFDRHPDGDRRPVSVEIYAYSIGPHRRHFFTSTAQALEVVREWHAIEMSYDYETEEYGFEGEDKYGQIEKARQEDFDRRVVEMERIMEGVTLVD